jgi:uncharacterized protein
MLRSIFRTSSPGINLLLLAFILILCLLLSAPFIQLGAMALGYSPGVLQNLNTENISGHLDLFRLLQVVQSFFIFIIPPFLFAWLAGDRVLEYLQLKKKPSWYWIIWVATFIFIAVPFLNLLAEINSKLSFPDALQSTLNWMKSKEKEAEILTDNFLGVKTVGGLIFNLFMIALLPAIGEELLFRGVLQKLFHNWFKNYHWAIWITAVLFTAMHFQFLSLLPRLLLGALFGYLLVWSGTLWLPIIAHFINNAVAVIFYWLTYNGFVGKQLDEIGTLEKSIIPALISLVLVLTWLVWFYRDTVKSPKSA